ncbi:MAG: hypothetical protein DPW21_00735 [Anaerolineae bacterium]|nr:hypothetical protein [Chloroflexi bacterium CFX2]MCQ3945206.1 hypothetical protein [Anaerolineae bacterium]
MKIPPATTGRSAITITAFNHRERNQVTWGNVLAIASGGPSTARINNTALAEAKANNIPPMAINDPNAKAMEIKLPRKVRFNSPNVAEVAVVD